jgi:hypothetical protein
VLIIPSSWGSQLGGYPARIKKFFWRRCWGLKKKNKFPRQLGTSYFSGTVAGEKEDFCKGSFALTSLTLFIVLLYFIFACIVLSKIQKKLVPTIVVIFVGLLLSCFIMLSINGWFL